MNHDFLPNDTLQLHRIELENFRCFAQCSLELHPHVTVLVADNGKGKTTLLKAIMLALESVVFALKPSSPAKTIEQKNIRRGIGADGVMAECLPTVVTAHGTANAISVTWERRRTSSKRRLAERVQNIKSLRMAMYLDPNGEEYDQVDLPVLAYYKATRTAVIADLDGDLITDFEEHRLRGYDDCFDPMTTFSRFIEWYGGASEFLKSKSVDWKSTNLPRLINAVNESVQVVLGPTEWSGLLWEYDKDPDKTGALVVEHEDGRRLPARSMSDGVRTTIALVADIAYRCCLLNPQFGELARINTQGVVLIDEVDLHLHPGWQQQIVPLLRDAFPKVQFVLSTHSPQVLSTVENDSIRVVHLSDGVAEIRTPDYQTRGVESADVLAEIMGIDPVPPVPEARMLSEYRSLIETRKLNSKAATKLRSELLEHFGTQHPVIKECERLERFFAFKDRAGKEKK